ncbi:MAG: flagellar motor switch protein FliG [Acidobacteriota bacterium]|nr:flagellar motor switch protein FliG [Acidobacteriota bacterium]
MAQAQLSGSRKAAILMVLLGDEASSGVFRFLQEEEINEISKEISRLGEITPETADTVLEDFYRLSLAQTFLARGGPDYAKKLLLKAFGADASKKLLDFLNVSLQSAMAGIDNLQKADPVQLSKFIQSEQPQTIALVMAHLNATQAAALLSSLPSGLRADVVMRMANLEQISPDVIGKITSILEQKMRSLGDFSRESYGGIRAVADLVNRMESKTAAAILEKVEDENPGLALSIRNLMFTFDDVLLIDDAGIREILQRVDKKALTIALKGTSDELRTQFFRNMSSRAVEMLREDMDVLGPVKVKDVEAAQQQIVSIVRTLDESGVISIRGGGGDEYVN